MASSSGIGTTGTRILAPVIAVLGIVIIVRTLSAGGGPFSIGVLLGVVFLAIGAGRFYLSLRAAS